MIFRTVLYSFAAYLFWCFLVGLLRNPFRKKVVPKGVILGASSQVRGRRVKDRREGEINTPQFILKGVLLLIANLFLIMVR